MADETTPGCAFEHATWLYPVEGEPRIFEPGEEHPGDGWFDHPRDAAAARATAGPDLAAENAELKAQIAKFDPDGDGKPGGARRKAEKAE